LPFAASIVRLALGSSLSAEGSANMTDHEADPGADTADSATLEDVFSPASERVVSRIVLGDRVHGW
jgi:hypothetical protein